MKIWKHLSPKLAHEAASVFFNCYSQFFDSKPLEWAPLKWKGLSFANRLGAAGGFDKNGEMIHALPRLGAGFLEIGTVTPLPQKANPGRILDRDWETQSVWNKMGFPNDGAREIALNLEHAKPFSTPVFVNIGKNRQTQLDVAWKDYVSLRRDFSQLADAFVLNISSPNTQGLRTLLQPENLSDFLRKIFQESPCPQPTLLKLSPDLSFQHLQEILLCAVEAGIEGFILTNTTLSRWPNCPYPVQGGVSGAPLAERSKEMLSQSLEILSKYRQNLLLVSAGGILNPQNVRERLQMGADLVQIYSGLVFYGPDFFRDTAKLMKEHSA